MRVDLIILLLVLLLVIGEWTRIRRSLHRLLGGLGRGVPGLKKAALWLSPEPSHILSYEPLTVIGGSALVILVFAYPAFSGFFIAEDFTYLTNYQLAGNHFLAGILTPINHIFFRPSAAAWNLTFNNFLPAEPWAHHLRNWLTTVVAAALLYALLRRLVASPIARAMGVGFFAISKVHLTTIGYINCNDSIMSLIQIEATVYLLIVYFQTERPIFLYSSYIPYTLEVFSRDYGIGILAIVGAALFVESRRIEHPTRFIAVRLAPFAAIAGVYFVVRLIVLRGGVIAASPAYHLTIDPTAIAYRAWIFAGNVFNVSLAPAEVSGSGSFATLLHGVAPGVVGQTRPWDAAFVLLAALLLGGMILVALYRDQRLWIPIVWAAAFIAPTFLIKNIQMYYILESLAAVSLMFAMTLKHLHGRYWRFAAAGLLGIMTINNAVESRFVNAFSWRFCANAAGKAYDAAVRPHLGQHLRSWTLVVADNRQVGFWQYTLTADGTCPMIPTLLGVPELRVNIVPTGVFSAEELLSPDAPIYIVSGDRILRLGKLSIDSLVPASAAADTTFNVQPDGNSALWVNCKNALPTTVVHWNGEPLATSFGSDTGLSALVPARLLSKTGIANVSLRDRQSGLESAPYTFHLAMPEKQLSKAQAQ